MKRIAQSALACILAAASVAAWPHAVMKSAVPEAGAVLEKAPPRIELRFNEKLEASFSGIQLIGPTETEVPARSHLDANDPRTLQAELPVLPPGAYRVRWRAVGGDGHLRKGEYGFTVR